MKKRTDRDGQAGGDDPSVTVSKSHRKREMLALQRLGTRLMELKPSQWRRLGLGEGVLQALEESLRIKEQGARRRHQRRMGKLLRGEDLDAVEALLRQIDERNGNAVQRLHLLERWRDRLLTEGDAALERLLDICPEADHQRLRQLIRDSVREQEAGRPPAARRRLFGLLDDLLPD